MLEKGSLVSILSFFLCTHALAEATAHKEGQWEANPVDVFVEHGMHAEDAESLCRYIANDTGGYTIRRRVGAYKCRGLDIVPGLMALLKEEKLPFELVPPGKGAEPGETLPIGLSDVYWWLGACSDPRAEELVLDFFYAHAPHRIERWGDVSVLKVLMYPLGWQATTKAIDLVFEMLQQEYWLKAYGFEFASGSEQGPKLEIVVRELRQHALRVLAESGQERALAALATGEGIPEDLAADLPSRFETAVRHSVGFFGYPELAGREVPPEILKRIENAYREYNKTYVPKYGKDGTENPDNR